MNIAVLVSGGVDSSVALRLLQQQGHNVRAFYLKIWLEDELSYLGTCPWQEDLSFVQAVCSQAGVPLEVISFQREYWNMVVSYTISEIRAGRTPNPDVMCNHRIKFGAFEKAVGASFDALATGHYAHVIQTAHGPELYCAPDPVKDQTYFLSYLDKEQLAHALFPLGKLCKEEVRALAHTFDLPNKSRKDSQGICFLGKLKFSDFIKHHMGVHKGALKEYETGKLVGEHDGFWYYTIGQRKGIGLSGGPWYVVAKDVANNIVYVSRTYYAPEKERASFTVEAVKWISHTLNEPQELHVKVRHGEHFSQATVTPLDETRFTVHLNERDQGIAPGQFAVFYDGSRCLGGGVITEGSS